MFGAGTKVIIKILTCSCCPMNIDYFDEALKKMRFTTPSILNTKKTCRGKKIIMDFLGGYSMRYDVKECASCKAT